MTTIVKKDMNWQDKDVGDCSHIYSDGRGVPTLFESDSDKIEGKNLIAVTALGTGVTVLMLVVMTTHFHAIASGPDGCRKRFSDEMRRKLERRRSSLGLRSEIRVRKDDIKTENELKDKIMYDFRNPVAAGYGRMPWLYVGGPGDIFFSDHLSRISSGRLIKDLPVHERRRVFHTRVNLPPEWRFFPNGEIVPDCYVDWKRLEGLFRSPRGVLAFMYQSKEKEAMEDVKCAREFIMDMGEKDLRRMAKEHCRSLHGKEFVSKLSLQEKVAVAQGMWAKKATYSIAALARAVQIDKHVLEMVLLPPK